jgi:hypothetical protein
MTKRVRPRPQGLPERIAQVVDLYSTQKAAAEFADVTPVTVQNWIKGSQPPFVELTKLAIEKGVDLRWLATGEGDIWGNSESVEAPAPAGHLRKPPSVKPGDLILCGMYGVSMPADWLFARVLWTDGVEMLTEHRPPSGGLQRNVWAIENTLAVGTQSELIAFRERARKQVIALRAKVDAAEQALLDARRAVYDALESMGAP